MPIVRLFTFTSPQTHTAITIAGLASRHSDYSLLAGRVYMAALHRVTTASCTDWVSKWGSSTRATFPGVVSPLMSVLSSC